jgi:hypothetical protein
MIKSIRFNIRFPVDFNDQARHLRWMGADEVHVKPIVTRHRFRHLKADFERVGPVASPRIRGAGLDVRPVLFLFRFAPPYNEVHIARKFFRVIAPIPSNGKLSVIAVRNADLEDCGLVGGPGGGAPTEKQKQDRQPGQTDLVDCPSGPLEKRFEHRRRITAPVDAGAMGRVVVHQCLKQKGILIWPAEERGIGGRILQLC